MTAIYGIAADLRYRRLDDEVAVYLADRFQTHLLDDTGWQVMEALQQLQASAVQCTVDALVTQLIAELPATAPGGADAQSAPDVHADARARLLPVLDALTQTGVLAVTAC